MVDVDTSCAQALRQAFELLKKHNDTFAVSRADRAFRAWLERYQLKERIDPGHVDPSNRHVARRSRPIREGEAGRRPDREAR
jgi:hypothetical protein